MRANSPTFVLGALAGLLFGVPLLLVGGYIWQGEVALGRPMKDALVVVNRNCLSPALDALVSALAGSSLQY